MDTNAQRAAILAKIEEMRDVSETAEAESAKQQDREPSTLKDVDGFSFEGMDDLIWSAGFNHGLRFALSLLPKPAPSCLQCSQPFPEEEAMNCPSYPDPAHGLYCTSACLDTHMRDVHDLRRLA